MFPLFYFIRPYFIKLKTRLLRVSLFCQFFCTPNQTLSYFFLRQNPEHYYKKIVDNSHHVKRDRGIIIHCVLRISIILPLPLLADEMDGGAMKSGQVVQPLRQNRIGWLVGVAFTTGPVYC